MLKWKRITADRKWGKTIDQTAQEFFDTVDADQLVHIEFLTETNSGNLRSIVVLYTDKENTDGR